MENFVVSARKYRPVTFDSVVGQEHITITLKNALRSNQLAQAFLFCGPRGVGKTTCARILAKTINCLTPTSDYEACGMCDSCQAFQKNGSLNVYELDAASNNSVEDIRSLVDQVRFPPQIGSRKVYIIDEVHMLSNSAFNAFLKTLEEPPSYVIFILATTEKHKIIPTILSRCQIFDFKRIEVSDITPHLRRIAIKEGIEAEDDALELIAQKADGGLRDALSLFDMISTFSADKKIDYATTIANLHILDYDYYFRVTDAFLQENLSEALLIYDEVLRQGFDGHNFVVGLAKHFRDLLVCQNEATLKLLEVPEKAKKQYAEQARKTEVSFLLSALNIMNQCDLTYKNSKNPRLQVELDLMKITHIRAALSLTELPQATDNGEKKKLNETQEKPSQLKESSSGYNAPKNNSSEAIKAKAIPIVSVSIDIKELEKEVHQSTQSTGEKKLPKPFGLEDLQQFIAFFRKRESQNIELQKILNRGLKIGENYKVILGLEKAQITQFEPYRQKFVELLQKKLENNEITLEIEEVIPNVDTKPYSNFQKFEHLQGKNPLLEDLKKKLGLEIDN